LSQVIPIDTAAAALVHRLLARGVERRMKLNGRLITWADVMDYNLCVSVGKNGRVEVATMARCATCERNLADDMRTKQLGLVPTAKRVG